MKKRNLGICALSLGRPWGNPAGSRHPPKLNPNAVEVVGGCSFRLQAHKHLEAHSDLWDNLQCIKLTAYLGLPLQERGSALSSHT